MEYTPMQSPLIRGINLGYSIEGSKGSFLSSQDGMWSLEIDFVCIKCY